MFKALEDTAQSIARTRNGSVNRVVARGSKQKTWPLGVLALALATGCSEPAASIDPTRELPTPVHCDAGPPGARLRPPGGVWFGVNLDWDNDSPAAYGARVGRLPAVVTQFARIPLTDADRTHVEAAVELVAPTGAMLLLTLEPHEGLQAVDGGVVEQTVALLAEYNARGVPVLLRFAHEMNGSWYAWSQQPEAYVAVFRQLAKAVHAGAPATAMLWAPNYGGGYPFRGGRYMAQEGSADHARLDTNGDGALGRSDDPYAPYYPGDDAVDWVGMSLYHWGSRYPWGSNDIPEPGKFVAMLTGTYNGSVGDERMVPDFDALYAERRGKPLGIFETAALYAPGRGGASAAAIKSAWWGQVYSDEVRRRFPALAMINWFEWDKHEVEINGRVDWGVTRDPGLVAGFKVALPRWLLSADDVRFCTGSSPPAS